MGNKSLIAAVSPAERGAVKRAANEAALRSASISLEQAASITGASVDRLSRLVACGEVLAFTVAGDTQIPLWQLQSSEVAPAIPGAAALAHAFPGSLADLNHWISRPNADLAGDSPGDALKRGEEDRVLALAGAIAAAGR
jgi:hypothetical protein